MLHLALMLVLVGPQNDPGSPEPVSTKDALERFKTAYRSKNPADRAAAVAALAQTQDEKVVLKLGALLTVDDKTVRIASAKGLSRTTGDLRKKAIGFLARAFGPNSGEAVVCSACVLSLEAMQDGLGYAILKANLRSMDTPTSLGAARAAGEIRDKSFVTPLIEHERFLEKARREALNVGPGGRTVVGGLPGMGMPAGDPEAPKRARILIPVLNGALASITGQDFRTSAEWAEWWRRNEADFKGPP